MRNRIVAAVAVSFCLTILCCSSLLAYLAAPFSAKYLLRDSDVVCRVHVLSVHVEGTMTDTHFRPPLESARMVARAKTVSVIKGAPAAELEIAFPNPLLLTGGSMVMYTDLVEGEDAIIFLKKTDSSIYEFHDPLNGNGALKVSPKPPKYDLGQTPHDKMLAELLALAAADAPKSPFVSIAEQLGEFGDVRAAPALRKLSVSKDIVARGVALASRIRAGDPPSQTDLLSFFRAKAPEGVSMSPRMTNSLPNMQQKILSALGESVRDNELESVRDTEIGQPAKPKRLPGFDYLTFLRAALATDAVKGSPEMRREIARVYRQLADQKAAPDLIVLLDDPDQNVRYLAATGLANTYAMNEYYVSTTLFAQDEAKYVGYWKDWWKENGGQFQK